MSKKIILQFEIEEVPATYGGKQKKVSLLGHTKTFKATRNAIGSVLGSLEDEYQKLSAVKEVYLSDAAKDQLSQLKEIFGTIDNLSTSDE